MSQNVSDMKTQLEKDGIIAFVPGGVSMWPTLKDKGQSVVVQKKTERLQKMDVALFLRADGSYVLHRVMAVLDDGYVMLGDSQINPEKVSEDQVIGKMTGFYRGKKYVDVNSSEYVEEIKKWFANGNRRKRILKRFYFKNAVKRRLKKIFCRKQTK